MKIKVLLISLLLALGLLLGACSKKDANKGNESGQTKQTEPEKKTGKSAESSGQIHVISREDGSGTRGAFIEITGLEKKEADGSKKDHTSKDAIIQNSTDSVLTTVAGDKDAIGYISLGSLNDTVKALKIDGHEATSENVSSGQYPLQRPFLIAWKGELSANAKDFMGFIKSKDGQDIIAKNGYISVEKGEAFTSSKPKGTLVISGSTSVTPLMEKLVEAYNAQNPDLEIDIQATGSSAGIQDVLKGAAEIAMSSRDLKENEPLEKYELAKDGIAVIVNKENPVEGLTSKQLHDIYTGEIKSFSDIK